MRATSYRSAILLLPFAIIGVHGQQAITPGGASFEVASVKVNKSGDRAVSLEFTPDRVRIRNYPIGVVLMKAYNIYERQLTNPGSVRSVLIERYDIDAKAAHPVGRAEMLRMLQSLLADRFKLAMHSEQKEVSGYALVVDAGKNKLSEHAGEGGDCELTRGPAGEARFRNCSMDYLAGYYLSGLATDKVVVDKTGLKGSYDFELLHSREVAANPGENRPAPTVINPDAPSIFTAVKQQLGLRLQPEKLAVSFFSIDHMEKPSEN